MIRIDYGRDTINVFHNDRFLVAQTPDYHQPSGSALYAPLILSTATAVRLHRASRMIAADLLNPRSRGASRIQTKCYVSHVSSIKILSGWYNVHSATPGAARRISYHVLVVPLASSPILSHGDAGLMYVS